MSNLVLIIIHLCITIVLITALQKQEKDDRQQAQVSEYVPVQMGEPGEIIQVIPTWGIGLDRATAERIWRETVREGGVRMAQPRERR